MSKKPEQVETPKKKFDDPLDGKKIHPVNGHVLIELLKKNDDIKLPPDLRDREYQGRVVAVAGDVSDYSDGDYVIFEKFADSAIDKIPYGEDKDGETIEVTLIKDKLIMGIWK